jgi:hypothetical protein
MPDHPDHPEHADNPDRPDGPDPYGQPPYGQGPYGQGSAGPGQAGDPSRPWEQPTGTWPGWQDTGTGDAPQYPRQNLLPQEVKPGRNRKPLFIAIAVVIALVIAGGVAYLVLRDDGEDTRAAYCAALRDLTNNGDLTGAFNGADATTADKLKTAMDLAPNAVADDWKKLDDAISSSQSGSPDMSQALTLYASLRAIANDAQTKCHLDLGIPML